MTKRRKVCDDTEMKTKTKTKTKTMCSTVIG